MKYIAPIMALVLSGCFSPAVVVLSGCSTNQPWITTDSPRYDMVVLVKETNTLYRRYIQDGDVVRPNMDLIRAAGQITEENDKITVYSSFEKAMESGNNYTLHVSVKKDSEEYFKKSPRKD